MTPRAFEDLLDRHGAAPTRWPDHDRAPAAALLATSEEARAALALMQEAERLLRASRMAPARGFDAAQATRPRQMRPARRAVSRLGWASAAAAALAIGVLVGGFYGPTHDDEASFTLAAALGPVETGYVD